MTRDGTVGRSDATERNLALHRDIDPVRMMRPRFADPIRASSPSGLHQQAGHMTASDLCAARERSLARRGPSTHEAARVHHAARRRGGSMAARGARAAGGARAAHRRADACICGRCGISSSYWRFPAGAAALQGWSIGRNVRIDMRWATSDPTEIRKHAAELAALAPDVILAHGASTVGPLLQVTRTVPIVFPIISDPVAAGFVDSLARPGGNATGFMVCEYGIDRVMAGIAQRDRAQRQARGSLARSRRTDGSRPVWRHPSRSGVA